MSEQKIARVAYRLDTSPATYDFMNFLGVAETLRREQGIDKLVVALVPGRRHVSLRDKVISVARHQWRAAVLLPALARLFPACAGVLEGDADEKQTVPYLVKPFPRGAYLDAPDYAKGQVPFTEPFITLTVRQSWFQPERDTQPVWNELIPTLGMPVVVVPDTEAELDGIQCCITAGRTYAAAAFKPALRMALYQKARLNLFTSGGPMTLGCLSDINAECFGVHVPGHATCEPQHLNSIGMTDGVRVQNTRIHWDRDPETIMKAVKERL